MSKSVDETIEELRTELLIVTGRLERRNRQFESISSGFVGWFLGFGLWLTALTYTLAGIAMTEQTAPLAIVGFSEPLWIWKMVYSLTLITATWLWFKPKSKIIEFIHWMVPTINLAITSIAVLAVSVSGVITGEQTVWESLATQEGHLLQFISVTYILLAQYTFLRLSILLKRGKPYEF